MNNKLSKNTSEGLDQKAVAKAKEVLRQDLLNRLGPLDGKDGQRWQQRKRTHDESESIFWKRVIMDTPDKCWNWSGSVCTSGYGQMIFDGKRKMVHRLAYELVKEPIPKGMCALHHCDNPRCVNPDHLYIGTKKDNAQDATIRNRWPDRKGERHPYSKLSNRDVKWILRHYSRYSSVNNTRTLANKYHVDPSTIWLIVKRKHWTHI